jgi:small subunit ribosomal protein S2
MTEVTIQDLLENGVHFGHLKSKWNPGMKPYIFMEKNGIHLIDLKKTHKKLEEATHAAQNIAKSGKKILFVATKKQAKGIIEEAAQSVNMPFVTERWLGGMLTNFSTVRKSIKKMSNIDKMMEDNTIDKLAKKERLILMRERQKLEAVLGGIADLTRIPAAIYIVDINKEHIAAAEADALNLTSFAIVDTNSDPSLVDYPIPANDDSTKSISLITKEFTNAIQRGLNEREELKKQREKKESDEKTGDLKESAETDAGSPESKNEEQNS